MSSKEDGKGLQAPNLSGADEVPVVENSSERHELQQCRYRNTPRQQCWGCDSLIRRHVHQTVLRRSHGVGMWQRGSTKGALAHRFGGDNPLTPLENMMGIKTKRDWCDSISNNLQRESPMELGWPSILIC